MKNRLEADFVIGKIGRLQSLPAIPDIVNGLLKDIKNPNSQISKIAGTLKHDQALTAKILRIANSAFYATKEKIASLEQATVLIGLRNLNSIILRNDIFDSMSEASDFWMHTMGTACASRAIVSVSKNLFGINPDEAFVLGLLHDIGRLALENVFPKQCLEIPSLVKEGLSTLAAEREIFECDHATVGSELIKRWSLPMHFSEAIACHHAPELSGEKSRTWTCIIHFADIISRAMLIDESKGLKIPNISSLASEVLNLSLEDLTKIFHETEIEIANIWSTSE